MQGVRLQYPVHVRPMDRKDKLSPNDFVVLLMGATGSGKSVFIENLASNHLGISSKSVDGATQKLTLYELRHPTTGQRVVLVDTPGTADLHKSENAVVQDIGRWLKKNSNIWSETAMMRNPIRTVFLQSAHNTRLSRSSVVGVKIFKAMAGKDVALSSTILTTAWDQVNDTNPDSMQRASARHNEMKERIWVEFVRGGAAFEKFFNTFESASELLSIITRPIHSNVPLFLDLQKEVISQDDPRETKLGRIVDGALTERLTNLEQTDAALREDLANKTTRKNAHLREALEKQHRGVKQDLRTMKKEKQTLESTSKHGCFRLHFSVAKPHSADRW